MKPAEPIDEPQAVTPLRRGRLFRRYFALILALVCGALVISGGTGLYFSYQENKASLAALQQEKAVTAATHIEQFVRRIEQQLAFAAPQIGGESLQQRRLELMKLQRFAKDVTDVSEIDGAGRERLFESRLAMSVTGSGKDRSQEPAFRNARPGQAWFGPVYFRKETEPYMAIALRSGGEKGPVIVAEVNLKFMWDVVTGIKVGQKGKAYVVDRDGYLIADPDIGLVLRKTDLSGLEQVRTALRGGERAMVARDSGGKSVLTAWAPVDPLGWKVFVEQPASEVFQALDASILRTVALIVAGLIFSALAAAWLARSMARPIGVLQQGAQRIGAGELEHRIDVHTGDELEALAGQFNRMTAQLRESYAGLERKVEERTSELRQALDFQRASGEILSSISSSIANTQPVFDAIVRSLLRLFGTQFAVVQLLREGQIHLVALASSDERFKTLVGEYPRPLDDQTVSGRAMLRKSVVQFASLSADADAPVASRRNAERGGSWEAIISAPMLRDGKVVGALVTARLAPGPFDEKQVALLRTFADQAVIAIENARLVNETREALERQTATAEVLGVISGSPTNVQPVFEAILDKAVRLCDAELGGLFLRDGDMWNMVSYKGDDPSAQAAFQSVRGGPHTGFGRLTAAGKPVHIVDLKADSDTAKRDPLRVATIEKLGARTFFAVPLLKEGGVIGAVVIYRREVRPFSEAQIRLVTTFADQAVIAIENVRLFNETKEALEQQTATSEILKVISSSTADTQPVFDAIVRSGLKLFPNAAVAVVLPEANEVRLAAIANASAERAAAWRSRFPFALDRRYMHGLAILERRAIDVADAQAYTEGPLLAGIENFLASGSRAVTIMPMLRGEAAIGAISVIRDVPGELSRKQVALLRTFADQAVIAIENVRLFNETKEALEHQTATSDILSVISSSPTDTAPVFQAIARSGLKLFSGASVTVLRRVGEQVDLGAVTHVDPERARRSRELYPVPLSRDYLAGKAILDGELTDIPDVSTHGGALTPASAKLITALGYRALTVAPMMAGGVGIGAIAIGRDAVGALSDKQIALLRTFADQAVIAIQNAALFREIREKSAQLEVANKHKSEFLANMSHELRTPLNAIIGFSEVLMEKMFGEVNEKQLDYLKDIHESGRHLLSLINDILDLSKIEAGRMELELSSFHLPTALSNAMTLVRERAQRHGIRLGLEVDPRLGELQADERKVKQIVVNLLSNAVKFTPDGGRVDVTAKLDTTKVEIAVKDTGIGIAAEDQQAVFEEFKQVGRDYTRKAEGTGLGLALTKKFVELHGGEIRLESTPGKGSTFTFTLPVQP